MNINKQYVNTKIVESVTGEYSYRNFSVLDIINKTPQFLVTEAEAVENAGIDAIKIRYIPERSEIEKS